MVMFEKGLGYTPRPGFGTRCGRIQTQERLAGVTQFSPDRVATPNGH